MESSNLTKNREYTYICSYIAARDKSYDKFE